MLVLVSGIAQAGKGKVWFATDLRTSFGSPYFEYTRALACV